MVTKTEQQREYLRAAVDNMRQAAPSDKLELSYKLACYTKVIKNLYNDRTHQFTSAVELRQYIENFSSVILGGQNLERDDHGLSRHDINAAVDQFMLELLSILNVPHQFDPAHTLALIEYRMRYIRQFYKGGNRRITEALCAYYLMRRGHELPQPIKPEQMKIIADLLPNEGDPQDCLEQIVREVEKLDRIMVFNKWVELFRGRFRQPVSLILSTREIPKDPFSIKNSSALDHDSTTYDKHYITRTPMEIDRLREATGKRPELLVVFRPERMALQETIAASVTSIKMEDPTEFIQGNILGNGRVFETDILPQIKLLNPQFEADRELFDEYVNDFLDDYFYIVNPNMEIRHDVDKFKSMIVERVNLLVRGKHGDRLVQSRDVFHHLIADELLRRRYLNIIAPIVDDSINNFLSADNTLRLPLKPDNKRLAWITIGGPASGKSSLEDFIAMEYTRFVGQGNHLCQVNSDHYKPLLLEKNAQDPEHGARTYWESGQVRQRIMDRLEFMITSKHEAPDYWVSTMTPTAERMKVAGSGGARVSIYVVSCPVEGTEVGNKGALQRAYDRALNPNGEDYFRFMSAYDILENHRAASALLPGMLVNPRDFRLFDSSTIPNSLTASMDSYNRELRIFNPTKFIDFVKKTLINADAESESSIYPYSNDKINREIALAICQYSENGVCLNFRYRAEYTANPMISVFTRQDNDTAFGANPIDSQVQGMWLDSQPESFAWIGHGRATIRDLSVFIMSIGEQLAIELLPEIGKRWNLTVNDYFGNILLRVDKGILLSSRSYDANPEICANVLNEVESRIAVQTTLL